MGLMELRPTAKNLPELSSIAKDLFVNRRKLERILYAETY